MWEPNLRRCSRTERTSTATHKRKKLPALSASGPLRSSQLRTGTGEMLRATLSRGLYSNIDNENNLRKDTGDKKRCCHC